MLALADGACCMLRSHLERRGLPALASANAAVPSAPAAGQKPSGSSMR